MDKAEGKLTPNDMLSGSTASALWGLQGWDPDSKNTLLRRMRDAKQGIYPEPIEVNPRMLYGTNAEVAGMTTCLEMAGLPINDSMFQWKFDQAFFHADLDIACSLDGIYDIGDQPLAMRTDPKHNIHTPNNETIYLRGKGVIEHKTTSSSWETDDCPEYYLIQAKFNFSVMQSNDDSFNWYAVSVIYGNEPHIYFFEKDPDFPKELNEVVTDFYRRVKENDPYPPNTSAALDELYPDLSERQDKVKLSPDAIKALQDKESNKRIRKDLDAIDEQCDMIIKAEMGDQIIGEGFYENEGIKYQVVVKWGTYTRKATPERLIAATPEITKRAKTIRAKHVILEVPQHD